MVLYVAFLMDSVVLFWMDACGNLRMASFNDGGVIDFFEHVWKYCGIVENF